MTVEIVARVKVRLLDCWCAELDTQQGKSAQKYVESMARNKPCVLFIPESTRTVGDVFSFNRALGYVWIDGDDKNLSERLVEANYATKDEPK